MIDKPAYLTVTGVVKALGISWSQFSLYSAKGLFPEPDATCNGQPVWMAGQLHEFQSAINQYQRKKKALLANG